MIPFMKFEFKDEDSEVFGTMKLNPTDPRLITRCKDIANFFSDIKPTSDEYFETAVEEQFCKLLGYDCKESLFGRVAATAIMADGRTYANHILDVVTEKVGPEIQKRRRANIARHAMKYAR
jgi:hypothetical protein